MTKRPSLGAPSAVDLLTPARLTRETVADFNPMILYQPRRGQAMMSVLDGSGSLEELVAETLSQMRMVLGPAEWIAITTDAYVKATPVPEDHRRGNLADAFAEGDPLVQEQLVVLLKSRYKPAEAAAQTYRYSVQDQWEWDPPEVIREMDGATLAVLERYL